jgi:hypothetical protein
MTAPAESRRLVFLGAALVLAAAALAGQLLRHPSAWLEMPLYDYVAFWSAGRLNQLGEDPYDPDRLAVLQREVIPDLQSPLVMWPAPWALTPLRPFCFLESHLSHLFWMVFNLAVLGLAVDWCWRSPLTLPSPPAGGEGRVRGAGRTGDRRWLAWLTAATFVPCYVVLLTGQMGPLMLLGFVGFLHFLRRGRDGLAGACLLLAAIKPQLGWLFWIALLVWAIAGRRWRLILGGLLATVLLLAWPLYDDPQLLGRYWVALTQRTQTHGHWSPVWGTALRFLFGRDKAWLQFVPVVPGLLWLAWYARRQRRGGGGWDRTLTPLLFASFLTAPYGAWPFDLVLFLPALLDIAATLPEAPP